MSVPSRLQTTITSATAALLLAAALGCQQPAGTPKEQGAAKAGVAGADKGAGSGAATGAAVGAEDHRLLGALLGSAVGRGHAYLIGASSDRITGKDRSAAEEAEKRAQTHPATPQEARAAPTADQNGDGFVTTDEVVAMKQAGLSDQQMLAKLQATGQVFELTPQSQDYLRNNGVDENVIAQMEQLNRATRDRLLQQQGGVPPAPAPAQTTPAPPPHGS